jgi:dienelactone hydrolase
VDSQALMNFRPIALAIALALCWSSTISQPAHGQSSAGNEMPVVVESNGWQLIGDLSLPESDDQVPAVLMLNQAAGDRTAYADLAHHLAARGIASLRLDLPGHGESINKGRFVPGERQRDPMIWDAEADVFSAYEFLAGHERIDTAKIAIVGASYSGEEMAEAGRLHGYAAAYVALSPGSFGDESVAGIDTSGVPWLFVTSRDERFLQEIRAAVTAQSESVEQIIVPGAGHASNLLSEHPDLAQRIAVWLDQHLKAE